MSSSCASVSVAALAPAFAEHQASTAFLPAWWREKQRAAFAEFEATPYPKRKDERWRFSSLARLAVEDCDYQASASASEAGQVVALSNETPHCAGRLVYADHTLAAYNPVSPELAKLGVIFEPIETALLSHEALVREHFAAQSTRLGADKFAALHSAFTRAGALLYVPPGVEVKLPLTAYHWGFSPKAALFPHTLIIAGANSAVSFVDFFFTRPGEAPAESLAVSMSHIFAGEGSRVRYKALQNWSGGALAFHLVSLTAQKDAYVKNLAVNLGARQFRSETQSLLEGPGSRVETYSLSVAEKDQEVDQRTLQIHNAPHASSDLLFKSALLDNSRSIFSGLIKVAPDAQKTDAYQSNRNLLLSPAAEANSLPGLEIGANDVRCTHGATTSQIDEAELFYMQARGVRKDLARQLAVFGFFEEVIAKIDNEEIRDHLRAFIQRKFARASAAPSPTAPANK